MSIRSEDENASSMFHFTSKVRSMKHGIGCRKLQPLEKKFLLAAEHGDIPTVKRYERTLHAPSAPASGATSSSPWRSSHCVLTGLTPWPDGG